MEQVTTTTAGHTFNNKAMQSQWESERCLTACKRIPTV